MAVGKVAAKDIVGGMTAVGAGLAGFFLGIMAADGFATIGAGLGVTGESLKTLMANFFGAFSQAGMTGVAVLGAILLAGSAMAAGKVKAKAVAQQGYPTQSGFLARILSPGFNPLKISKRSPTERPTRTRCFFLSLPSTR